jgi:(2Fe-2S) ferredoxin
MYATTGCNAPSKIKAKMIISHDRQWYSQVPGNNGMQNYVLEDEEDELP